jgi:hypothetical protein
LGIVSSQRVESAHSFLKGHGYNRNCTLANLIKRTIDKQLKQGLECIRLLGSGIDQRPPTFWPERLREALSNVFLSLAPSITRIIINTVKNSFSLTAECQAEQRFTVTEPARVTAHTVATTNGSLSCSCSDWRGLGLPCCHMIAVATKFNLNVKLESAIAARWWIKSYWQLHGLGQRTATDSLDAGRVCATTSVSPAAASRTETAQKGARKSATETTTADQSTTETPWCLHAVAKLTLASTAIARGALRAVVNMQLESCAAKVRDLARRYLTGNQREVALDDALLNCLETIDGALAMNAKDSRSFLLECDQLLQPLMTTIKIKLAAVTCNDAQPASLSARGGVRTSAKKATAQSRAEPSNAKEAPKAKDKKTPTTPKTPKVKASAGTEKSEYHGYRMRMYSNLLYRV